MQQKVRFPSFPEWGDFVYNKSLMKKIILGLSLILASNIFAQSMIESLQLKPRTKELYEVIRAIKLHAASDNVYLSLGESHHQPSTTAPVSYMLAKQFLDARNDVIFCAQNIELFLNSYDGTEIVRRAFQTKLFTENTPQLTDFKGCEGDNRAYLTYSGFFHQHPFARSFPKEFEQTPIITQTGNNIAEQMTKSKGLFISQMELDYLEMTATSELMKSQTTSLPHFSKRVDELLKNSLTLRDRMKLLYNGGTAHKKKMGVFLSPEHFKVVGFSLPANSYMLITDLESRIIEGDSFFFLNQLMQFRKEKLKDLLFYLAESNVSFTKGLFEANDQGEYPFMYYGNLGFPLHGKTEILDVRHGETRFLMVAEPKKPEIACYLSKNSTFDRVNCYDLF